MSKKKAKQPTPRQIASRVNGRKGGLARAKNLTVAAIKEIGSRGGKQTHARYTDDYYSHIAGKRKTVGRYRTPVTAGA